MVKGFKCPFCNQLMSLHLGTEKIYYIDFYGVYDFFSNILSGSMLKLSFYKCPNENCNQITVHLEGVAGLNNRSSFFYPHAIFNKYPDYVPEAIRQDYEEACTILNDSPKAAATLARRCLQGMIHDYWGIHKGNLKSEILELKDKVSPSLWKVIDSVRELGNIGAHMEKDVSLIIDINPKEAKALIMLVERLIKDWYIERHEQEQLEEQIINITTDKKEQRQA